MELPGLDELDVTALRMRVRGLHERIVTLEANRYDMEMRLKVQDMDVGDRLIANSFNLMLTQINFRLK